MNGIMTLAALATLNGSQEAAALYDLCVGDYPELGLIPGRGRDGVTYTTYVRKSLPSGGFRSANSGVALQSSEYDSFTQQCYIFDIQATVDKAVAMAHPFGMGSFLADELEAHFKGSFEVLANQIYYGDSTTSEGFRGFQSFLTDSAGNNIDELVIDAGGEAGSGVSLTSVYVGRVSVTDGIGWCYGNNGQFLSSSEWREAQERYVEGGATRARTVLTNGTTTWLGLQLMPKCLVRIANVPVQEDAPTLLLTEEAIANAIQRFPNRYKPTHIFMNRQARFILRKSLSLGVTGVTANVGGVQLAPDPTSSNGLPIVVTDALLNTEAQAT